MLTRHVRKINITKNVQKQLQKHPIQAVLNNKKNG